MATITFSDNINNKLAEFKTEDFFNQEVIRPLLDIITAEPTAPNSLLIVTPKIIALVDAFKGQAGIPSNSSGRGDITDLLLGILHNTNLPLELRSLLLALENIYCDGLSFGLPEFNFGSLDFLIMALTFKLSLCEDKPLDFSFFLPIFLSSSNLPSISRSISTNMIEFSSVGNDVTIAPLMVELEELMTIVRDFSTPEIDTLTMEINDLTNIKNLLMSRLTDMIVNEEYIGTRIVGGTPFSGHPINFSNNPDEDTLVDGTPYPNNAIYEGYVPKWDIGVDSNIRYKGKNITGINGLVNKVKELDEDINSRKTTLDSLQSNIPDIQDELIAIAKLRKTIDDKNLGKISLKKKIDDLIMSSSKEVTKAYEKVIDLTSLVIGLMMSDESIDDDVVLSSVNSLVKDLASTDMEDVLEYKKLKLYKPFNKRYLGYTPVFGTNPNRPVIYNSNTNGTDDKDNPLSGQPGTSISPSTISPVIVPSIGVYNVNDTIENPIKSNRLEDKLTIVDPVNNHYPIHKKGVVDDYIDNIEKYGDVIPINNKINSGYGKEHYRNLKEVVKGVNPLDEHILTDNELLRVL